LLDNSTYDEKKLLILISEDSNEAFHTIYDKYKNTIYGVAIKSLKSPVLAQEIVQDVFLKVWFERKNLPKINSFENWLFIVARNHLLNQLKKIAKEWKGLHNYQMDISNQEETPVNNLDREFYKELYKNAISTLTDHQRNVYELVKIENLSYSQVADNLHVSPLTVKKHMSRALFQIRKVLKESGSGFFF
jgi:RNA polymerase sigma-70 factor (ECF subfamily)